MRRGRGRCCRVSVISIWRTSVCQTYIGESRLRVSFVAPVESPSSGADSVASSGLSRPSFPITARDFGSHALFAAATVILPVTNELPNRDPSITKQMSTAARIEVPFPKKYLIELFAKHVSKLESVFV